ncbi:MAG: zinc ribbon domain-containing protein [Propionibacteriaceae bacterium]|jgi:putative FmdB family regulatory protein|nr:zinc ribbon domain-containing protein [Propionibacteriaceae bacterium]
MPTYQYRCTVCGKDLEVVQKFSDAPLTECPECSGQLRKVFSAVGVVFKGSGFYATDNRSKGKAEAARSADKAKTDQADSKPAADAKAADAKASSDTKPVKTETAAA